MFDWVKFRVYARLLSKHEDALIKRCMQQWADGNDMKEWFCDENEYYAEGFRAGWIASQVHACPLDIIETLEHIIEDEKTYERSKRQGKE